MITLIKLLFGSKGTAIATVVILSVATTACLLAWSHYQSVLTERDEALKALGAEEAAHEATKTAFTSYKAGAEQSAQYLRENLDELSTNYQAARGEVDELREKLADHDTAFLTYSKPGLMERRFNRGTKRVLREFDETTNSFYHRGKATPADSKAAETGASKKPSD